MANLKIAFDQPWWLLLLLLVPVLWIFSFRSLSGLGPYRRLFALLFRTVVFTLLVLALAGIQLQKISDRVTVIYLLDQSESIPKLTREAMLEYVMKDIETHRHKGDSSVGRCDRVRRSSLIANGPRMPGEVLKPQLVYQVIGSAIHDVGKVV